MDVGFEFTLNGRPVRVTTEDPHTTLLQHVRSRGLTGAKEGCAEGDCGACTVALVEPGPDGRASYRAVNACLLLLPAVAGLEVWTAEGIAAGERLHSVQAAMAAGGGSQCGYCTPGFVMSLFAETYREERGPGFDPDSLGGNLCRCTGYRPIRDAGRALGEPGEGDPFLERTREPAPAREALAYRGFHRPATLAGALALLAAHPEARLVAGGTDLGLEVTTGFRRFETIVSLEGVEELRAVRETPGGLEIGAAVPMSRLEAELRGRVPLLDRLWPRFASRQVRNRATLGGNLATASPIGDASVVLLALDAEVVLAGPGGTRTLPVSSFFTGYRQTALEPGELVAAVHIPDRPAALEGFSKIAKRGADDISTVAAAYRLELGPDGRVVSARLAYGGVAAVPLRARAAEAALEGRPWDRRALEAAKLALLAELEPISDLRASAEYRRRLVVNLLERFFLETTEPALAGAGP